MYVYLLQEYEKQYCIYIIFFLAYIKLMYWYIDKICKICYQQILFMTIKASV